jgi:hypothetical protein
MPSAVVATDVTNIRLAASAHLFVAPEGATVPTDAPESLADYEDDTLLDDAYVDVGLTSIKGVQFKVEVSTQEFEAHQFVDPIDQIITKRKATLEANLLEWSGLNLQTAFNGGTITTTTNGLVHYKASRSASSIYVAVVCDLVFKDKITRLYSPRSLASSSSQSTLERTAMGELPLVLTSLAPASDPTATAWGIISPAAG